MLLTNVTQQNSKPIESFDVQRIYHILGFNVKLISSISKRTETYSKAVIKAQQSFQDLLFVKLSPEGIKDFRKNILFQCLQDTETYDGKTEKACEGASEKAFGEYLTKYFNNNIKQNLALTIPDFTYPYSPDFAYIHEESNLHIDIEIDEPYIYFSGEPNHYLNKEKDWIRNQFFLDKKWIVLRFSEEQVVRHPDSCCKLIAEIVYKFTYDESILDDFVQIPDLEPIKVWTYEEAEKMAVCQFRNQYLKKHPNKKIIPIPSRLSNHNLGNPSVREAG